MLAIIQHALIASLLGLWVCYSYEKPDNRFALLLLVLTMGAGPLGIAICLLTAASYHYCRADKQISPCEWINHFFDYEADKESDRVHERIDLGMDTASTSHIEPFRDILIGGTVLQKQMAIAKMSRHFHPRFAPILHQAVQDSNAAVRVQAATALAKIEHDFMEQYFRYENDGNCDDLKIANLCDNYAHAGLLDEENCISLRSKAIAIYEARLKHCPDPDCQLHLARLYLRQQQPEKTCQLLSDGIATGNTTSSALLWYMEALFRLKKFGQLRQIGKHYAHLLKNFDWYKDTLSIWNFPGENAYA